MENNFLEEKLKNSKVTKTLEKIGISFEEYSRIKDLSLDQISEHPNLPIDIKISNVMQNLRDRDILLAATILIVEDIINFDEIEKSMKKYFKVNV